MFTGGVCIFRPKKSSVKEGKKMFGYKETMKVSIVEFAAVVLLNIIIAAVSGVGGAGIGAAAACAAAVLAVFIIYKAVKNEELASRITFILMIITEFVSCFAAQTLDMLPFLYIGAAVLVGLFVRKQLNIEFWIESSVMLVVGLIISFAGDDESFNAVSGIANIVIYQVINLTMYMLTGSGEKFRKNLEEKTNEAIEANESKSNFLANMSHEIRTPMNAICGMADLLLQTDISEETEEYVMTIKNSSENLLNIINDILDFSKVESGKMEIIPAEYQFTSVMYDVMNVIQVRLKSRVELIMDVDPNVPTGLVGDEMRFRQILINILNNAVKFTEKGSITLSVRWEPKDNNTGVLNVSVADTGIGIKPEDMDKLFTEFSQADTKRNRNIEGTGLGLAICKKLLDLMNGSITFESVYGKGSTFKFTLPQGISNPAPSNFDKSADLHARLQVKRGVPFTAPEAKVLIVDDNQVNIRVAEGMMKPYNMSVVSVTSGQEAINLIKKGERYDIILMDHMMPQMDGVEATQIIRSLDGDYPKKVPIIALTANAIKGVEDLFYENGMNDFLSKPVDLKKLEKVLRKWIPRHKQIKAAAVEDQTMEHTQTTQVPFVKLLDRLKGINVVSGLANCIGNEDVYIDVLRVFINSANIDSIQSCFDNEDWKDYTIEVHGAKSAARNIGATELSELAFALEVAGKSGDIQAIKDKTAPFLDNYRSVIETIKKAFEDTGLSYDID